MEMQLHDLPQISFIPGVDVAQKIQLQLYTVLIAVADMKYLFGCYSVAKAGFRLQLSSTVS